MDVARPARHGHLGGATSVATSRGCGRRARRGRANADVYRADPARRHTLHRLTARPGGAGECVGHLVPAMSRRNAGTRVHVAAPSCRWVCPPRCIRRSRTTRNRRGVCHGTRRHLSHRYRRSSGAGCARRHSRVPDVDPHWPRRASATHGHRPHRSAVARTRYSARTRRTGAGGVTAITIAITTAITTATAVVFRVSRPRPRTSSYGSASAPIKPTFRRRATSRSISRISVGSTLATCADVVSVDRSSARMR